MRIIICGAGEVGSHAAEVLASTDNKITVIDTNTTHLSTISESLDVATLEGSCADANVLRNAGCDQADLLIAVTDKDEVNILTAAIAKGVGAAKTIARVHHGAYLSQKDFNYEHHLNIDRLICPEYLTAIKIASKLRNPAAIAIETFGRGQIQMQQFPVSKDAAAIGKPLSELKLPAGTRLAAIIRDREAFIPIATSMVQKDDNVVLVGNESTFPEARKLFHDDKKGRRNIVLMGGSPMAVWLCRSLRNRNFSIRLFETDRDRAKELADKLDWITVFNEDPTDPSVFKEQRIVDADVFISLRSEDKDNLIASVLAKIKGVRKVFAVLHGTKYLDLVYDMSVNQTFSPSKVAVEEIRITLEENSIQQMSSLADGIVDAYRVRVGRDAEMIGKPLHEVKLTPNWIIAAIRRGQRAWVPGADDVVETGDTVLVIGLHGMEKQLKKLFATE